MLSRSAEGLYWIGRYLERTDQLCRLLREQVETLVDRPLREIHFGWRRIYGALGRVPPGANVGLGGTDDDFTLADAFTLADDLTFERSNIDSVWNGFSMTRENARQMRHCISAEFWSSLNLAWLRLKSQRIEQIWKTAPETFYLEVSREIDTLDGVAATTMYRDDGWRFRTGPLYGTGHSDARTASGASRDCAPAGQRECAAGRRQLVEPAACLPGS